MEVLVDLDGTLCDITHRLHHIQGPKKDWDAFFAACPDDKLIENVAMVVGTLARDFKIIYVSGRSDAVRKQTEDWITFKSGLPMGLLMMRRAGDHRPDHEVKREILGTLRHRGYNPWLAIDDRAQVVRMWREEGLTCLQVTEGDF